MSCPTCKESIISQTPSLIGQTQCTTDCPEDITCVDIIPSNCVFYSGATLSCPSGNTSVNYGDTVTVALGKMYNLICQNSTSNTVQITANDTCYGYLASKITSTSLDITISNPGACEKLNIEEKCWDPWTAANLLNGFTNFPSGQPVEYSSIKGCSVKLRGRFSRTSLSSGTYTIFKLPLNRAPLNPRVFSVLTTSSVLPSGFGFITVQTNGDVTLTYSPLAAGSVIVSLDGIEFETN